MRRTPGSSPPPGGIERNALRPSRDRGPDQGPRDVDHPGYARDVPGGWAGIQRMRGAKTRGGGSLPPRRARKHRGGRS